MADFKFDIDKPVDENVANFFVLMKLIDEEMADLLISNIDKMIPLPDQSRQKTAARVVFNKAIMKGLESLNQRKGSEE